MLESGNGMALSDYHRSSKEVSEQHENNYDDNPELVGEDNVYEQINQKNRQLAFNQTSEYAALKLDD